MTISMLGILLLILAAADPAEARDTRYDLPIADVMKDPRYAGAVPQDVKFYFAGEAAPAGEDKGEFVTNRKTNSFGKSDEEACVWAMMSALKELGERARQEGGNAVVGIVSFYKKNVFESETLYECHAGAVIAGVALRGRVIKVTD